jgi:hypothetical protein
VLTGQGEYDKAIAWLEPWAKAPYGIYAQYVLDRAKALREERQSGL